ncbi:MAG: rRNA maturation RNase YbeY [Betaproteobacteria bacterium]|nr:rRNA maturation RNase YbeY [Betaproteobacteria bacterium]
MAKQTSKPLVLARDSSGKSSKLNAEQLEVDFGGGRRLLFLFPETGGCDVEIEAIAATDKSAPSISVQPCASNVISLRVEMPSDFPVEGGEAPEAGPMLNLFVQKAVDGVDRINAPRKHHVRRWAKAALFQNVEVTVRLVGEAEGHALNKNYRGKDCATNVLTFTYGGKIAEKDEKGYAGEEYVIGDLVLCVPVVVREAGELGKALDAHFAHLIVHGMLHLQGLDHKKKADAEAMEAREREILSALGYADPYVV